MRRISNLIILGLIVAFAIWCAISFRGDMRRFSLEALWHSRNYLAVAILFSLMNYALRVVRWRVYLKTLGHSLTFRFAALTYVAGFAFTLSPGKLGEVMRARYYADMNIPFRDVAGAILVERIIDLAAMSLLATLILTIFPKYTHIVLVAVALIALALGALSSLPWSAIGGAVSSAPRLPATLARVSVEAVCALVSAKVLIRPYSLLIGTVIGLVGWGLEGLGLAVLVSMAGPGHLDALAAVGVYAIAVLVGALLFLPGGLGGTEAALSALLLTRGYTFADSLLITLACRFATLWFAVVLGWIAVIALRYAGLPAAQGAHSR